MEITKFDVDKISLLPDLPGVYKFYNSRSKLIYVGKAKNIRKRVSSYFGSRKFINRKTQRLVSEIKFIEYTVADSEFDAVLLENNLIKQNQPKYNIQLKDDKSFPYICITNERFPRIISTRRYYKNRGQYFGPYSSVVAMNNVLDLIRNLYTIRTCKYNLSEKNIKAGKFKVCLEYHIGNCQGPCEDLQSEENYLRDIKQAINILKGDLSVVENYFKKYMNKYSANLEFEKAQQFKDKLQLLQKFQAKTLVVNKKIKNSDVFTIYSEDQFSYVNYMKIKNGSLTVTKTVQIKKKLNEDDSDILTFVVFDFRNKFHSECREVLTNIPIITIPEGMKNIIPRRGDKKRLIDLSLKNALQYKREKQKSKLKVKTKANEVLIKLKEDLRLPSIPLQIECFDNSNLGGTNPVASMVCFKNGKPYKKEYRHFNIKTVQGPDDYASMKEIVYRRYYRQKKEGNNLPDLIVIDGGKGQLNAASQALSELELYGKIPIIGIAKRLEEIYFPKDDIPIHINKASSSLKLLQYIRNEAHRFAIEFHRNKRSKKAFKTSLLNIGGIGSKSSDLLLKRFKSLQKIREAEEEEIAEVVGPAKAKLITSYLKIKKEV